MDSDSLNSADEALSEMLGIGLDVLVSLNETTETIEDLSTTKNNNLCTKISQLSSKEIELIANGSNQLKRLYTDEGVCVFPRESSIPSKLMRRITGELVHGSSKYSSDKSYEKIEFIPNGYTRIHERRELTRFENFVNDHESWRELCYGYLAKCVSAICGEEMILYKEKLNLKPPGGSGFAPHLDSPSLRIALGNNGPSTFVTVMIAIDDMTEKNGCLKVCKGPWTEENHVDVVEPEEGGDPDAGGRAGAIHAANELDFSPIICQGGDFAVFNGWVPHRSSANASPFSRRAVFLTYNPAREGDFHDLYYHKMNKKREDYTNVLKAQRNSDHEAEIAALSSVPLVLYQTDVAVAFNIQEVTSESSNDQLILDEVECST
jgi:ectoine hydroxylase-related dioxygenase (phytanoyl-CoA dioxygenase family)